MFSSTIIHAAFVYTAPDAVNYLCTKSTTEISITTNRFKNYLADHKEEFKTATIDILSNRAWTLGKSVADNAWISLLAMGYLLPHALDFKQKMVTSLGVLLVSGVVGAIRYGLSKSFPICEKLIGPRFNTLHSIDSTTSLPPILTKSYHWIRHGCGGFALFLAGNSMSSATEKSFGPVTTTMGTLAISISLAIIVKTAVKTIFDQMNCPSNKWRTCAEWSFTLIYTLSITTMAITGVGFAPSLSASLWMSVSLISALAITTFSSLLGTLSTVDVTFNTIFN